ncbi:MAG: hypothetical protein ACE5GL_06315 [Calditrichia bacterium]
MKRKRVKAALALRCPAEGRGDESPEEFIPTFLLDEEVTYGGYRMPILSTHCPILADKT